MFASQFYQNVQREGVEIAWIYIGAEGLCEISRMIESALTIRNASDYDDMFIASKDETAEQIANAERVYKIIWEHILNMVGKL